MKLTKIMKPLMASCLLPLAFSAQAEDKMPINKDYNYVTVKAGLDQPTINSNNNANVSNVDGTYLAGIEVGRRFMDMFAAGLEYSYRGKSNFKISNDTNNNVTNNYTWAARSDVFMANVAVDLMKDSFVTPYAKLGLGAARNKSYNYVQTTTSLTKTYSGKTKTNFAWQIGLGCNIPQNETLDLDLAYMFTDRGKTETASYYNTNVTTANTNSAAKTIKLKDHAITFGIKFKF
jgi:opacity protein-like surface antigen